MLEQLNLWNEAPNTHPPLPYTEVDSTSICNVPYCPAKIREVSGNLILRITTQQYASPKAFALSHFASNSNLLSNLNSAQSPVKFRSVSKTAARALFTDHVI